MTNYDEGTQDEPVVDTPAPVKPTRVVIALNATFTGIMAGVLVWLVLGELERPSTWGRVGILAYAVLTGAYLWSLVKLLRRRWAKAPVTGYLDWDGDRWNVRPLVDDRGDRCGSCNGIGVGGPASGPETNGRCSDCQGSGVTAI